MSRPEEALRIMKNNNSFLFQANKCKGCLFAKADTVLTAMPTSITCFSPTLPILWPSWSPFSFFNKPRLFWLRTCSNAVPATGISLLYILNLAISISSFKSWFSRSFMLGPVLRSVGGSPTTSHHQLFVLLVLFVSFHDLYTICNYFMPLLLVSVCSLPSSKKESLLFVHLIAPGPRWVTASSLNIWWRKWRKTGGRKSAHSSLGWGAPWHVTFWF